METKALTKESHFVLKPNLLAKTSPEKACTTHPAVFKAAGKLMQDGGYNNLTYGDSPGTPIIKPEKIAEECGLKEPADQLGIPFGQFEDGTEVEYPEGRTSKKFVICDEILASDAIINVCKMKTHQLERITGAVKNTFGCVYGVNKAASHAKYPTAENFAKMIADLNKFIPPVLHIMDGITAMEGNGPQSGTPTQMNVILASQDPVALDTVFCHLVNLDWKLVPTNVFAMQHGVGTCENIEIITTEGTITPKQAFQNYGNGTFNVQRAAEFRGALNQVKFLKPILEKKPIVKKERCIGCAICVEACPVEGKAIKIINKKATYEYNKCIKCYCCQEMCPKEAITVKKPLLAKIADRHWKV
jgi:uncharacterized protein (DUF362 family)/NAD-dependent dihydropyrimidine dehydrogenase PreA subunit